MDLALRAVQIRSLLNEEEPAICTKLSQFLRIQKHAPRQLPFASDSFIFSNLLIPGSARPRMRTGGTGARFQVRKRRSEFIASKMKSGITADLSGRCSRNWTLRPIHAGNSGHS